jgi:UDP-N-acetylglucosamine 4,6-dehydratase/5-epimerase
LFKDKTLMITGGTGSFGNAVLEQFIDSDVKEIRIFSRDEKKQDDMRISLKSKKLKFIIGDVRDYSSVDEAMSGVDFVFHAAALKQVPSCEFYPMQAVLTNILGPENILRACIKNNVGKAIFLSTDKAVYPINAMGISKAMMEKLVVSKARNENKELVFCATRYGNVMASRGSVIPLFISQIKSGKPITITNPEMTRFMMKLDESVDLVKFAFEYAQTGDIFVKKAPGAKIIILAEALIDLFGVKANIEIIGTRHGEKKYETLLTSEEMMKAHDLGDYYRVPSDNRDLNYEKYFEQGEKISKDIIDYNSDNTNQLDREGMKKLLLQLDYVQTELGK